MESWLVWAWLRPRGCLRQGSCRGVVGVPGKGLAGGGLVGILGKDLAEDLRLLILI